MGSIVFVPVLGMLPDFELPAPQLVQPVHDGVHDGEEEEEQVDPYQVGHVERPVVSVGQDQGELAGLLKVGNVPEGYHALAHTTSRDKGVRTFYSDYRN